MSSRRLTPLLSSTILGNNFNNLLIYYVHLIFDNFRLSSLHVSSPVLNGVSRNGCHGTPTVGVVCTVSGCNCADSNMPHGILPPPPPLPPSNMHYPTLVNGNSDPLDNYIHKDLHYTCVQCNLSSLTQANYMLHIKQTHCVEVYRCILCKQMQLFDNMNLLKEHFFQVHAAHKYEVLKCKMCPPASSSSSGITFANMDELAQHVKAVHQGPRDRFNGVHHQLSSQPPPAPPVTQPPPSSLINNDRFKCFKCQYCDSDFTQINALHQHILIVHPNHHHSSPNNNNNNNSQPFPHQHQQQQNSLSCQYCRSTFTNRGQLERHMRVHLASVDLKCNICDRKFDNENLLNEHILTHSKTLVSAPALTTTTTSTNNNSSNANNIINNSNHSVEDTISAVCAYCKQNIENVQQFKVCFTFFFFYK